jgi:hypothetical protein
MPLPIAVHDPLQLFGLGAVSTLRNAGFDANSPDDLRAWVGGQDARWS